MLALFLVGTAACACALPRADLPETAFNETDTPVNVAPPVRPVLSIVRSAVEPIAVLPAPARQGETCTVTLALNSAAVAMPGHRRSCHALLCTFLI
jgi:hypothetical protein